MMTELKLYLLVNILRGFLWFDDRLIEAKEERNNEWRSATAEARQLVAMYDSFG